MTRPSEDGATAVKAHAARFLRDGAFTIAGSALTAIISLLALRMLYRSLGPSSYGVLAVMLAAGAILASLDFGLGSVVTRRIASSPSEDPQIAHLLRRAITAYAAIAVLSSVAFVACFRFVRWNGSPLSASLTTLILMGVAVGGDVLGFFGLAVLSGARRFDILSIINSTFAFIRSAAVVVVVGVAASLDHIALCYAATSLLSAATLLAAATRVRPWRSAPPATLQTLLAEWRFGIGSFAASFLGSSVWNSGAILAGSLGGTAAAGVFAAAQRIPLAVAGLGSRAAVAAFPAAGSADERDLHEMFIRAARVTMAVLAPATIALIVFAREVISALFGIAVPGAVAVLRVLALAMLVEGIASFGTQLVWGHGRVRIVLQSSLIAVAATVSLSLLAFPLFGVYGIAIAMVAGVVASAVRTISAIATQPKRISDTIGQILNGYGVAIVTAACAAEAIRRFVALRPIAMVLVGGTCTALSWAAVLLLVHRFNERRYRSRIERSLA